MVSCGLCGFEYEPGGEACRGQHCPLAWTGCKVAHCPRCGYTTPDEARGLAGWLSRLLSTEALPAGRLSEIAVDRPTIVERLDAPPEVAAQLTLLGFTPGTRVTLQQRFPAYVVDVDGVHVALERSVAETVWVKRPTTR